MFYIRVALLVLWHCTCCLCKVPTQLEADLNIDAEIATANIYYKSRALPGEPTELLLDRVNALNSKKNIKLIVHGFKGSRTDGAIVSLINAYLAMDYDNVLVADWAVVANMRISIARMAVPKVAQHLAKILNAFLNKHKIERSEVHIIGYSLGAHIAGGMGVFFSGTLGRVTGLDPALPLFDPEDPDKLHATDAQFVDVVHTDSGHFGDGIRCGHVDFYPHFGQAPQPGCVNDEWLIGKCSHNRSVILYAESIGQPMNFPTIPCTMDAIMSKNSAACLSKSTDKKEVVFMGEAVSRSATGVFYLETNDRSPFGKGVSTWS